MLQNACPNILRTLSVCILAASAALLMSSCGGGGGGGIATTPPVTGGTGQVYAYVLNTGTSIVSQYKVGSDGTLTSSGADQTAGSQPSAIIVDPGQRFLYVANQGNSFTNTAASIMSFTINSSGALSTPTTLMDSNTPIAIGVDSTGKYAITTNVGSGAGDPTASVYSINQSSGALMLSSSTDLGSAGFFTSAVTIDPGGPFVYSTGSAGVSIFKLSGGTLVANNPSTLSPDLYSAFGPTGKYAYGVSSTGTLYQGVVQSNGSVLANSPGSLQTISSGGTITISPSGKYAYIADTANSRIDQFTVNSSGVLTPMSVASVAVTGTPYSTIAEPKDRFLYVNIDDQQHPAEVAKFQLSNGALVASSQTTVFGDGNFHATVFASK